MAKDVIKNIRDNYIKMERSIVEQLHFETSNHPVTIGGFREQIWKSLFRQIIPHKFSIVENVFLIDTDRNCSREIDLAVIDEQYTPYIFNFGKIKFIPIEAVAIVIQCKSQKIDDDKNTIEEWIKSITKLTTSSDSIARMANCIATKPAGTQTATQPIKILCAMTSCIDENQQPVHEFDIAIYANKGDNQINICYSNSIDNLYKAYLKFNHKNSTSEPDKSNDSTQKDALSTIGLDQYLVKEHNLLSLIFLLNQLLMLINNPMLFPHRAYAQAFRNKDPQ